MTFDKNAIFWIDVEKILPNPYQPRREFNEAKLLGLADSIRQYGVLQPLVVTRKEKFTDEGGMNVYYELIAGERRLRASKVAGVSQVPAVIRSDDDKDNIKLELAIIENLQREDLNPVERADAFSKLVKEFGYKHGDIGKKIGKSREYVTNSIRILMLPDKMRDAIVEGKMKEGHSRPLLMLSDKPDEQETLFRQIVENSVNIRDAEDISRRIAYERVRKERPSMRPDIVEFEKEASEKLGTRVHVHKVKGSDGGRVIIDFSTEEDLQNIMMELKKERERQELEAKGREVGDDTEEPTAELPEEDIYSINNFSL